MIVAREDHVAGLDILYSFPHALGSPGIGTTAWHQVNQLVLKGHRVGLVTGSITRPVAGLATCVQTSVLAGRRIPRRVVGLERSMSYHDWRCARALIAGHGRYQLVHTWPLAAERTLRTAALLGVPGLREAPNTHTAHAYRTVAQEMRQLGLALAADNPHRFNGHRLATEAREWELASAILAPSDHVAATFRSEGFGPDRLLRHQYGYDPNEFESADEARTPGGLRAAFVGRCEPRKGLHHALAAWHASAAATSGTFTIHGSFAPGYREAIGPLLDHPSVRVKGFTDQVRHAYLDTDVLLLPSVEEGSALVVYEAMAMGCVPLVSDATGAYVTDGINGFVHAAGDIARLTAHIDALVQEPGRLERMRASALESSVELDWSSAVDRLVDGYRDAIELQRVGRTAAAPAPVAEDRRTVSVVICTRDRPDMLANALDAARSFTDPDVEILVVDSASRDTRTRTVAARADAGYVRVNRPGLSIARNVGLREATGDIIIFTDDDCQVAPGWIEPVLAPFRRWDVGAVSGPMADSDNPSTSEICGSCRARAFECTMQGIDAGHGALMAFDRRAVIDLGGFDELLGAGRVLAGAEDLDMFCRMLRAGWTVVREPRATVLHMNRRRGTAYVKLLHGYGLGLGALVRKFVRIDPSVGVPLGMRVAYRIVSSTARSAVRADGHLPGDLAMLRGIIRGAAWTLAVPVDGERFVDRNPPEMVDLDDGRATDVSTGGSSGVFHGAATTVGSGPTSGFGERAGARSGTDRASGQSVRESA